MPSTKKKPKKRVIDSARQVQFLKEWGATLKIAEVDSQQAVVDNVEELLDGPAFADFLQTVNAKDLSGKNKKFGKTMKKVAGLFDTTKSPDAQTELCNKAHNLIQEWHKKKPPKANDSEKTKEKRLILKTLDKQITAQGNLLDMKKQDVPLQPDNNNPSTKTPNAIRGLVLQGVAREVDAQFCLLSGGEAKPTGGGQSSSFFIKDAQGNSKYVFKPQAGEAVQPGWPAGGGVPREVVMSQFNELAKNQLGIDFGCPRTTLAELGSAAIDAKNPLVAQVGALQEFTPSEGSARGFINGLNAAIKKEDPPKTQAAAIKNKRKKIAELKKSITTESVQKMVLLDFITLNGDRNGGNLLIVPDDTDNTKKKLVPLDPGNMLPPVDKLGTSMASIYAGTADSGEMQTNGNIPAQLPQVDAPFDPALVAVIKKMNANDIVGFLKSAAAALPPQHQQALDDETLDLAGQSVEFLKKLVDKQPTPTVRAMMILYQKAFTRFARFPYANDPPQAQDLQDREDYVDAELVKANAQIKTEKKLVRAAKKMRRSKNAQAYNDLGYGPDSLPNAVAKLNAVNKKIEHPGKVNELAAFLRNNGKTEQDLPQSVQGKFVQPKLDAAHKLVYQEKYDAITDDATLKQDLEAARDAGISLGKLDPTLGQMTLLQKLETATKIAAFKQQGGLQKYQTMIADKHLTADNDRTFNEVMEVMKEELDAKAELKQTGGSAKYKAVKSELTNKGMTLGENHKNDALDDRVTAKIKLAFLKEVAAFEADGGHQAYEAAVADGELPKSTTLKKAMADLRRLKVAEREVANFGGQDNFDAGNQALLQALQAVEANHLPSQVLSVAKYDEATKLDKRKFTISHAAWTKDGGQAKYQSGITQNVFRAQPTFEEAQKTLEYAIMDKLFPVV